ncbi:hypothetical protein PUMCH_003399 [Australozyma saopauloensis]|uniref:Cytochrome c oxidase assembly factor 1 n=1 Tax=Australozyma saopauloensis TaxID=291208 RepID=A0AAX4HBV6_9ASCO|nr:hypothetical protein PUMCH_003399 [[Candida] saopauloensis]
MFSAGLRRVLPVRSPVSLRTSIKGRLPLSVRFQSTAEPLRTRVATTIDRELPDPLKPQRENRRYFVIYAVGVVVSCAIIFNYEKTGSPIINSLMYCLRRSEVAKSSLGDNIGYASEWPWIWGPLNTVQGRIDIQYKVKGDKQGATVHLKASRVSAILPFEVEHLYLEYADGLTADLLKDKSIDFEF